MPEVSGLNKLRDKIHQTAQEKGFHDSHEVNPLPKLLMLIVSELGEALEADRANNWADKVSFLAFQNDLAEGTDYHLAFSKHLKNSVQDEIADAIIRLFDTAGLFGIDLEKHIDMKMKFNQLRPKLHGKEY